MSEYQRLLAAAEALSDLAAYDAAKARLSSGEDELLPAPLADRLLDDESPLRVWREVRGLPQAALAQRASVNRVQIAKMESGRKTGSVATLQKLALALGLTVDDLSICNTAGCSTPKASADLPGQRATRSSTGKSCQAGQKLTGVTFMPAHAVTAPRSSAQENAPSLTR